MPGYGRLLIWAVIGLASVSAHRIFFAARFHGEEQILDVIVSFAAGLRFDLAVLPVVSGPYILIESILFQFAGRAIDIARRALMSLQIIWLSILNISLYASTFNYSVNEKHLGWEFFAYINDLGSLWRDVFEKDVASGLFYGLVPLVFLAGAIAVFRKQGGFHSDEPRRFETRFKKRKLFATLGIFVLLGIFLRGGLQQSPLRTADAMTTDSPYLNNLKLNGIFTVLNDSRDSLEFKSFYSREENIKTMTQFLSAGKISKDYPLLRRMPPRTLASARPVSHPRVIHVVLESFSSKFLAVNGYDPSIAPQFNELIHRGVYFRRFFATGGRSANGLFAMFAGIPDRAGRTILRSSQIQNRFGGLAGILGRKGYRTFFVHGGDLKFDNLNTALPHLGFSESYGRDEIAATGFQAQPNVLGYDDRDAFRFFLGQMDKKDQSFGVIFTQNTHFPYIAPDYKDYSKDRVANLFLSSYHYVDSLIGEFVRELEKRPYAKDTIVLFVADHTHHAGLNYIEDRSIPFLVYAPSLFSPAQIDFDASQLDILPGIVSLTGGNALYASMGNDPFLRAGLVRGEPEVLPEPFAFFAGGSNTNVIGWIQKDRIAIRWLDRDTPLFLTSTPPITGENFAIKEKSRLDDYTAHMRHYHQYARTLEKENRIWPEPDELAKLEKEGKASP
jgi:phosphoglycerol transferase MdoB-like AlkP superfamily enzyme